PQGSFYIFAPTSYADSLLLRGYHVKDTVADFPNFHISQLTGEFINPKTRPSVLQSYSILSVTP
ncbi:MAG: glycosyl transferase, partial [Bacteroidetes bacterium]|nr:glycosyl transferase [Bacteroidota bacterium]